MDAPETVGETVISPKARAHAFGAMRHARSGTNAQRIWNFMVLAGTKWPVVDRHISLDAKMRPNSEFDQSAPVSGDPVRGKLRWGGLGKGAVPSNRVTAP